MFGPKQFLLFCTALNKFSNIYVQQPQYKKCAFVSWKNSHNIHGFRSLIRKKRQDIVTEVLNQVSCCGYETLCPFCYLIKM